MLDILSRSFAYSAAVSYHLSAVIFSEEEKK